MSGCSNEYVASYVNNGDISFINNGASLVNSSSGHLKQMYSKGSSDDNGPNYQENKGRYGDAVYEISTAAMYSGSWYGNHSNFPREDSPFFYRGGYYHEGRNILFQSQHSL